MNQTFLANVAAALAAVSAGASVVATRYVVGETDPVTLAFYRYVIAAPCMLPFLLARPAGVRMTGRDMLAIAALGALFFGLFPWAFSAALKYTTAARGSVGLAMIPIATLLIASALGRERLTGLKGISVVLAFLGVTVAFSNGLFNGGDSRTLLIGDGLMMLAVLCGAAYSALARPYLARFGALYVTALAMIVGVVFLAPLSGLSGGLDGWPTFTPMGWGAVIFLGTVGGAIQFALYTWALRWIAPSRTAIYLTLNPVSAMLLATALLGEPLTTELLIGLVLVASGIILANRPSPPRPARA